MNVGQLQNLKQQVQKALDQAVYITEIRDRVSKGAAWSVSWDKGGGQAKYILSPDQKDMIEETMIKDMEDELKISMDGIKKCTQ